MSEIDYTKLNLTAYSCTVEEFKGLLLQYSDDKNAMLAISYATDGETIEGVSYRLPTPYQAEKKGALADLRARKNEFAPDSVESKLQAEYNKMSARADQLEQENSQLKRDLATEKAKSKPTEYPSIH